MANRRGKCGRSDRFAVTDFLFLGSKVNVDGDCSHEIRRQLLLGRKAMINLDSVLKSRDVTLPTKVHILKAIFPVIMYRCESWTIKKAQHWRIDALELWCWRRLLGVPGDKTSQSWRKSTLNSHWKDGGWSSSSSTLASWCKQLTHCKRPWCWERLKAEGEEGELVGWHHWFMNFGKLWEMVRDREAWHAAILGVLKSWTWLGD